MFNRYAFFRNVVPGWGSFGNFLKQYSQTLQPYIKHWVSVKDFVAKCNGTYDNPGCKFRPTRTETYPGTSVPMGQLRSFLKLQATPWSGLPASARALALRMLSGRVPNPVGNATEVADTKVYFRRKYGRAPTRPEWERYTRSWAEAKGWAWRPREVPYDQFGHNALFVTTKATAFPRGATRVLRAPGVAPGPVAPPPSPTSAPPPSPISGGPPTPTPWAPPPPIAPAPTGAPGAGAVVYDGSTPAPGTVETRRSYPNNPPVRGDASRRSRELYDNILNQFAVGVNPRYAHRNGSTFCNIYVWDVTRAMGAEIPHWVDPNGDPTPHNRGRELNANAVNDWLNKHGARFGWRKVPLAQGIERANRGYPVVASWKNPGKIGHISMIRPGDASETEGPWMAQAGATNSNRVRMFRIYGKRRADAVEIWTHS